MGSIYSNKIGMENWQSCNKNEEEEDNDDRDKGKKQGGK